MWLECRTFPILFGAITLIASSMGECESFNDLEFFRRLPVWKPDSLGVLKKSEIQKRIGVALGDGTQYSIELGYAGMLTTGPKVYIYCFQDVETATRVWSRLYALNTSHGYRGQRTYMGGSYLKRGDRNSLVWDPAGLFGRRIVMLFDVKKGDGKPPDKAHELLKQIGEVVEQMP